LSIWADYKRRYQEAPEEGWLHMGAGRDDLRPGAQARNLRILLEGRGMNVVEGREYSRGYSTGKGTEAEGLAEFKGLESGRVGTGRGNCQMVPQQQTCPWCLAWNRPGE
jgi:hypothetical protein